MIKLFKLIFNTDLHGFDIMFQSKDSIYVIEQGRIKKL